MSQALRARTMRGYLERRERLSAHFETLEQLEQLPVVLTKDDLRRQYPFGLLCVPRAQVHQYHESFGTTGIPIASPLTRADLDAYVDQILLTPLDLEQDDLVLVRFPYAISVPAHLFHRAAQRRGAGVVAASSYSAVSPPLRVLRLIEQLGVTVLACLPYEAVRLGHLARQQGYGQGKKAFGTIRAVCVAGELLGPAMRRYLEQLWQAPVYQFYGSTEAGNVAYSCRAGSLHVAQEFFELSLLPERAPGPQQPAGLGTLVLTTLQKEALPLYKYDTEDLATLTGGEGCSCGDGRPVLRLWGRRGEHYNLASRDGEQRVRRVFYSEVKEAVYEAALAHGGSPIFRCTRSGERLLFEIEQADPKLLQPMLERRLQVELEVQSVPEGSLLTLAGATTEPVQKPRYCFA